MSNSIKIAIDVMGSDKGPEAIIIWSCFEQRKES